LKTITNQQDLGEVCPECNGFIITNKFQKICTSCGLIVEETLSDTHNIWNNIKSKQSKQYVAIGNTSFVEGLGTHIGYKNDKYFKDINGKAMSPDINYLFNRLKKYYEKIPKIRGRETEHRTISLLNNIAKYLGLNGSVIFNTVYYYRKIRNSEEKIVNNVSLIAFCLYFSITQQTQRIITISEVADTFNKFGSRVTPRLMMRDGLLYGKHIGKDHKPYTIENYLNKFLTEICSSLWIKTRLIKKEISYTPEQYKKNLTQISKLIITKYPIERGFRPSTISAAIIYCADRVLSLKINHKRILTQKIIADTTGVHEFTLREIYNNYLKPKIFSEPKKNHNKKPGKNTQKRNTVICDFCGGYIPHKPHIFVNIHQNPSKHIFCSEDHMLKWIFKTQKDGDKNNRK